MSSKNKPHQIVSGAGWLVQFAAGVFKGLHEKGMSDEAIHSLGTQAGAEAMERGITAFVAAIAPAKGSDHLRYLQTVTLAPTKGDVTLAEAGDVFTRYLDPDFENWGTNVHGEDTEETSVDVYEMKQKGNYQTLFSSLGDPQTLCLTQAQIKEFFRSHYGLLRQQAYATFCLFEVKGRLFVTDVDLVSGNLKLRISHFALDHVWHSDRRHRVVVKQQNL